MGWRDRYRRASFRGVEFLVEASETGHGRRLVVHEYPYRELPYAEDLGRKARTFVIEGYLVDEDYDVQRDRLLLALEQEGPGELVHPYRGTLTVIAGPCTVREENRNGRTCTIAMTFLEAGVATAPQSPTSPARAAGRAADDAGASTAAAAAARVRVARRPAFVAKAASDAWFKGLKAMAALRLQDLEKLKGLVAQGGNAVVERLALPVTFCTDAVRLIQEIGSCAVGKIEAARAYVQLAGTLPDTIRGTSAQSLVAAAGALAINQLVRQTAAAEAARYAAGATYASYEEAIAMREAVLDAIEQASLSAPDSAQDDLIEARRQLVGAVPPSASDLPHLDLYTPATTLPAVVIAYAIYGDRHRADEIVARNGIEDPLLVTGGVPIEVLVDAA